MSLREAVRLGAKTRREAGGDWIALSALTVTFAAAVVLAVIMAGGPGHHVRLDDMPLLSGGWSLTWDEAAAPPGAEQAARVQALRKVTAGIAALVAMLSLMMAVGLWRQRLRLRAAADRVHWAVGARSWQSAARGLGEGRGWMAAAGVLCLLSGLTIPWLVERTWVWKAEVPPQAAVALLAATAIFVAVLRWEARSGRRAADSGALTAVVSSPTAVATVGFTLLTGVGLLSRHAPGSSDLTSAHGMRVADVSLAGRPLQDRRDVLAGWQAARSGVADAARGDASAPDEASTPADGSDSDGGPAAFGLASVGTSVGLGHSSPVWVDCGVCFEGGLPLPIRVVRAEVHAVASDTFPFLGLGVREGRDFSQDDGGVLATAIVSRALAARHFQEGHAVGRRIRVGDSGWLEVVGVVDDPLEARDHSEYAVYLPLAGAAPEGVEVILAGGMIHGVSVPAGVEMGRPRGPEELFGAHAWFDRLMRILGIVTAVMVFGGVWLGARNEARATAFEVALRKAVGARNRDLMVHLVVQTAKRMVVAVGVGAWLALFLGAGLNGAYGGIPQMDPVVWSGALALVMTAYVMGWLPTYRTAVRMLPAEGLGGH